MTGEDPRVVVLVTEGCHLCEAACAVVAGVCSQDGVGWVARDLATVDEATRRRWRDYVPVVIVDGKVHDVFRVTSDRLSTALAAS